MLRNVHLHGRLGEKFIEVCRLDVATAAEAIRALSVNFKNFLDELKEGSYQIVRGDIETGFHMELEDVAGLRLGDKDLHIVPAIEGSKSHGGLVKTLIGVALIGVSIFTAGGGLAAAIGSGSSVLGGGFAANLGLAGVALTLAGVARMLTPSNDGNTYKSSLFTVSPTAEEGCAVPLCYGRFMAQGVLISAGLNVEEVSPYFTTAYPGQNYPIQDENSGSVNGQPTS